MRLRSHGFDVGLPDGWEGAVSSRGVDPQTQRRARARGRVAVAPPVLHLTSAALPADRGDFGSGAVDALGADDVFVAVVEYGPESIGTALFAESGVPRRVGPADFSPRALQRTIDGQSGLQVFCTEGGRAFCLYVVLGDHRRVGRLSARVTDVLSDLVLDPVEGGAG